jgi:hypothetical protein
MSIQYTYDTLTEVMKGYAEDYDDEFVANLPDMIGKGELRCLRDLDLELFEEWLEVTISGSDRTVARDVDVADINGLWIRDPSGQEWVELPRRSFEYCLLYAPVETTEAMPEFYSELSETEFYVVPTPNQTYANGNARIRATIRPTGLSESQDTTFLSLHFADLLFQACMVEVYDYLKHTEKMQTAATKYQSLLPSLEKEIEDAVRKHYKGLNKQRQGADD